MSEPYFKHEKEIVDAELAAIEEEEFQDSPAPSRLPYVIEGMIPANQVHLLGGPSGGGKTTLAFQMLKALAAGAPFLGRQTVPQQIAYVSGDRPADSVLETQDRCGVSFPIFSLVDENMVGEDMIQKVFPRLTANCGGKRPTLVYVDGFTSLVPGGFLNNYSVVAKWLAGLQRYCRRMGVTLIGACHTAKTKENEKFTNARQRIAGSVAWAGFTETVLIIEPLDDSPAHQDKRMLSILPRNHRDDKMVLTFNSMGRLQVPEKVAHQESRSRFLMEGILEGLAVDEPLMYSSIKELAAAKEVHGSSFDKRLKEFVVEGKLIKKGKGIYVVPISTPEPLGSAEETQAIQETR